MKEERAGERQELVDSCWSVYFEDITLLQMFSSTQRKRERKGQGRMRVSDWRVRRRLPGWTHRGGLYDLHILSAMWSARSGVPCRKRRETETGFSLKYIANFYRIFLKFNFKFPKNVRLCVFPSTIVTRMLGVSSSR